MPEPNSAEIQAAAELANQKYGHLPRLLSQDVPGTEILTDQEKLVADSKDPLTGLETRRSWEDQAQKLIGLYQRTTGQRDYLVLTLIDVDYFKQINDQYGHLAGDNALRALAQSAKTKFRNTDVLGRLGGDEFVQIGISGQTEPAQISHTFEQIRQEIAAEPIELAPEIPPVNLGQSWGIAIVDRQGIDQLMQYTSVNISHPDYYPTLMKKMIALADTAAYAAKQAGRNCSKTNLMVQETRPEPARSD